jgi:nitrite reductase/ring-hydroxylating ferredoxin subunit
VKTIRVLGAVRLQHGETRVFSWPSAFGDLEGFVIRHGENLRAYENKCKHLPIPLDYGDGEFWYDAIDRIVCKTHGATYEPDTGYCDDGPCEGASLTRFDVELDGEDVVVLIPD